MSRVKENIKPLDKEGRIHGKHIRYYPDGSIQFVDEYKHGVFHGLDEHYHMDGKTRTSFHFKNGNIFGSDIKYIYA